MTCILNRLGYWVDIVVRTISQEDIQFEDKYDVFIGIGSGDSGRYFPDIAARVLSAIKIFYADIREPDSAKEAISQRYRYFSERHQNQRVELRRFARHVDIKNAMGRTDAIFCIGNDFTMGTYVTFRKPIWRIYPSSSPKITVDIPQLTNRNPQKFLYFGGNGNIVKGLDLAIEAFAGLPDLEFHICAPRNEKDFYDVYRDVFRNSSNIHYEGFILPGSKVFNELTAACGYIISPSCSEGTATAITTCMRRGLVPVVTKEVGVDIDDFGYPIEDIRIEKLREQIRKLSEVSQEELTERSIKTYFNSFNYTQARFSESFERALLELLYNKGVLSKQ